MIKKSVTIACISAVCFLFTGFLSSCCKTTTCKQGSGTISLVGFPYNASSTLYLRKYQLNTNFSVKIDTVEYTFQADEYERKGDTLLLDPYGPSFRRSIMNPIAGYKFFLEAGYDYELVLPYTGRTSRITDITETGVEQKMCFFSKHYPCNTVVNSLKVDGVQYAGSSVIIK